MDADDEFGDLYADIGSEMGKSSTSGQYGNEKDGDIYNEDDEELLYGPSTTTTTSSLAPASKTKSLLPSSSTGLQSGLADKEVDNDERLLYGQLYGVTTEAPDEAATPMRTAESKTISGFGVEKRKEGPNSRVPEAGAGGGFSLSDEVKLNGGADVMGRALEIPLGGVSSSGGDGVKGPARASVPYQNHIFDGFSNQGSQIEGENTGSSRLTHANEAPVGSLPGLAGVSRIPAEYSNEEDAEPQEMRDEWEEGEGAGEGGEPANEGWADSESEDDLQIVLNDEPPNYGGTDRPMDVGPVEGSEDEDEEDLIIVAGDDDASRPEEQEWEGEPPPTEIMPGLVGAPGPLGSDRPPGAEERGPGGKGGGAGGLSPGVPRIGYSGQGYQSHHMQYKYVRPGAAVSSAMTVSGQGSPQRTGPAGRGAPGGPTGGWVPGKGGGGRGDWSVGGGRGSGPRSQGGGGGVAPWGGARGFSGGMEFNLPPTKTVFDVDLDSLEEKPWRRLGIDLTDYFNFGFNENTWKQYCRQLAQLRLEATMQSKIRVYESGRSEQEYDPDLPPELAAAAGHQEAGDPNGQQQRSQDVGPGAGGGRGRGAGRGRTMLLTGRAIQVDGGGGERRPSADVRRQRTRDSDAVIQIVLQDASDEEPAPPVKSVSEDFQEEDEDRGGGGMLEQERRFFRPGGHPHWEMEGPLSMWEREDMPVGPAGMPMGPHGGGMMPGPRMDVDGLGPFPVGPGMPMHHPGPRPNFGMFPVAPFGPPPVGRGGMARPPLYNGPRPALPLAASGPPPDVFLPMMMPPVDYHKPSRRRTPPLLSPPRRTPPHGLLVEWSEEPSNGSDPNWNLRESRSLRETKDYDGHGDWVLDSDERADDSFLVRRGRDLDRPTQREKSVESSLDRRSDEHKRFLSRDLHGGEGDWDGGGHRSRSSKKQKVQVPVEAKSQDYVRAESQKPTAEEERDHSWECSMERQAEEEISHQRSDGVSKSGERKKLVSVDDSLAAERKESTLSSRQEEESKDRRHHLEREEAQRKKVKEEDSRHHRIQEEQERDRRSREDLDRDRRRARKEKEDERVSRSEKSKWHGDDHSWTSREREEGRARKEVKRSSAGREFEKIREKRRREEDGGKVDGRLDRRRESYGRGRRSEKDDDIRSWEDSRKYEDRSVRVDSGRVVGNHSTESRRTADEDRPHKEKSAWDGISAKGMLSDRNGSISNVGEEKSYRSHTEGSKKRKVDEYRASNQFDKASTRDSDELAASRTRHKERKVGSSKRGQDGYFSRRLSDVDTGSHAHRGSREEKSRPDIGSSEEEEERRRGRSKLERWTSSKKEADTSIEASTENRKKYQDAMDQEAPSSSQHAGSDRQQRIRGEQEWKVDRKQKQRLLPSAKRPSDVEVKELAVPGVASTGNDTASDPQPALANDISEKRKERIERLRLQAAERQKHAEDALLQPCSVEEVKPERPARKRRWGNG